jgi:hypothetical protein
MLNATFNNITVISRWSVLLVDYVLLTGPLYPHADWYSPFLLSKFVLLCTEETGDNNRREDIDV